jgi:2-succinyl-5-enolpyruvyl-6-hydroxy-3-cyclohexene-1-carboxylate synthase
MDGATLASSGFLTPPRILIPKLVASRDGWKDKAGKRKRKLKAAHVRIRDLEVSRDRWHERATAAEAQVIELRRQQEQAQATAEQLRDELEKKLPPRR